MECHCSHTGIAEKLDRLAASRQCAMVDHDATKSITLVEHFANDITGKAIQIHDVVKGQYYYPREPGE